VREGRFREDLFHRLNVIALQLPPLRERREDIPLLLEHALRRFSEENNRPLRRFTPAALKVLVDYHWPGNVRELENAVERAVVVGSSEMLLPEDLPETLAETAECETSSEPGAAKYHDAILALKKQLILSAFEQGGGSFTEAAKLLGVHPNYLHRLVRNLDLRMALKTAG